MSNGTLYGEKSPYDEEDEARAAQASNMSAMAELLNRQTAELQNLRYQSAQVRLFFKYDAATRTWTATLEDREIDLLNVREFFKAKP